MTTTISGIIVVIVLSVVIITFPCDLLNITSMRSAIAKNLLQTRPRRRRHYGARFAATVQESGTVAPLLLTP
jgi:hypothetical protein